MYDFRDVIASTKDEQIRAWSVEQAIEYVREMLDAGLHVRGGLLGTAVQIEDYVRNGKPQDGDTNG